MRMLEIEFIVMVGLLAMFCIVAIILKSLQHKMSPPDPTESGANA